MLLQPQNIIKGLFRKIRITQAIVNATRLLFLLAYAYFALFQMGTAATELLFILFLVFLFASYAVTGMIAERHIGKLAFLIFDECRPDIYAEVFKELLGHKKFRKRTIMTTIDLANGYLWCGDFREAYDLLQSMGFSSKSNIHNIFFYVVLGRVSAMLDNFIVAERSFAELGNILKQLKKNTSIYHNTEKMISSLRHTIDERKGEYEPSVGDCQSAVKTSANNAERIVHTLNLARAYLVQKDYEKARQELNYVIENGKTLFYVNKAKDLLNSIAA
jgi:tetratricopeptide (TPR) repeat protein